MVSTYLILVCAGAFLFSLLPLQVYAQHADSISVLPADSSKVYVRTIDDVAHHSIASDDAFSYTEAKDPETLWSRIKRWLFSFLFNAFENDWLRLFFKITFFLIFGLVLLALINQLLGGNIKNAFSNTRASQAVNLGNNSQSIEKLNLDKLLEEALSRNSYSDAVRLLYLKALEELNAHELINWKADKTNHDYIQELRSHPACPLFSRLTNIYEYVEYGDFNVERKNYDSIRKIYEEFRHKTGHV